MARDDSKVMGLFGSGTQALLQAECTCAVTGIEEIRVYSTRKERRERVAAQLNELVGVRTVAVDHPRDAVSGCDIVTTATSSNEAVFDGQWLEPGTHVNTMIGSDYFLPRRETDDTTVLRSDIIIVVRVNPFVSTNSRSSIASAQGTRWSDIYEIGELLVKKNIHGRSTGAQITYHNNNVGMGIGSLPRPAAVRTRQVKGVGAEVDSAFFMQYDDDLHTIRDGLLGRRRRWRHERSGGTSASR